MFMNCMFLVLVMYILFWNVMKFYSYVINDVCFGCFIESCRMLLIYYLMVENNILESLVYL